MNYTTPNFAKQVSYFLEREGLTFAELKGLLLPFNKLEGLSFGFIQGCTKNIVDILGVNSTFINSSTLDNGDSIVLSTVLKHASIHIFTNQFNKISIEYNYDTGVYPSIGIFYSEGDSSSIVYIPKLDRNASTILPQGMIDVIIDDLSALLVKLLYKAYEVKHGYDR